MKSITSIIASAALLALSCATPEGSADWDSHYATALCVRAETLLGEGRAEEAQVAAEEALEQARALGDTAAEGRARYILALVGRSPEQLEAARRLLDDAPLGSEAWRTRLVLAQLALDAGELESATADLQSVLRETKEWDDVRQRAHAEAVASHLMARIQWLRGEEDKARASDRWAALQLTLVPESELLPLRRAVAQSVGDDNARRFLYADAFAQHARAANIAARLGDNEARLLASRCMSRDLMLQGRLADAIDHYQRAVTLARSLERWNTAVDIAHEALDWMDSRGEPWNSERRRPFNLTLDEARQRDAQGNPKSDDSTSNSG